MPTMALDLTAHWDFSNPALSERRFRDALVTASADERLILQTQIARTYGLRRDFAQAQQILARIEPQLGGAGAEARIRHALESGRTLSSAAHSPQSQTADVRARARAAYEQALDLAKGAARDDLAVDALHMLAFVDTAPADQLKWGREALAIVEASSQPLAMRWEASLRNNVGHALHQLGRYEEALAEFRKAVELRETMGNAAATRAAHWMVARTLRALDRPDEALAIQLRLERESDGAGSPDPHVYDELQALYAARGDSHRAAAYGAKREAMRR